MIWPPAQCRMIKGALQAVSCSLNRLSLQGNPAYLGFSFCGLKLSSYLWKTQLFAELRFQGAVLLDALVDGVSKAAYPWAPFKLFAIYWVCLDLNNKSVLSINQSRCIWKMSFLTSCDLFYFFHKCTPWASVVQSDAIFLLKPDMIMPQLSARFAILNLKWVTYMIHVDLMRKCFQSLMVDRGSSEQHVFGRAVLMWLTRAGVRITFYASRLI